MRATPDGKLAGVEGHEHRIQARGGRLAAALAGRGDGPLADGLGVAGRGDPEAVPLEGFALFAKPEGTLGLARSARKRLGCQPTRR
jgi:hypothetical protein